MSDVVLVAIITGVSVVLVGLITGGGAILGSYVGGWRESRNQATAWQRDQRKAAYADLLLTLDRFHEEADAAHFSGQRPAAPVHTDSLYQQTVALARMAMMVRLVGSSRVQQSLNDLMNHCFANVMPSVYKEAAGSAPFWDKAMGQDFWAGYDQFVRAAREDLGLSPDYAPPDRSPVG